MLLFRIQIEALFVVLLSFSILSIVESEENVEFYYSVRDDRNEGPNSEYERSPYSRHIDMDQMRNVPMFIFHPNTPIKLRMRHGEDSSDFYRSLNPDRVLQLIQAVTSNLHSVEVRPSIRNSFRRAKSLNASPRFEERMLPNTQFHQTARSMFTRNPISRNIFSGGLFTRPSISDWNQRFKKSLFNMFPSVRPFQSNNFQMGLPTTNNPFFLPNPTQGFQYGSTNPYLNQPVYSNNQNMYIPQNPPIQVGDFATAASYGHPIRSMLHGQQFIPHQSHPTFHANFGPDLATSGSIMMHQHLRPPINTNFAKYAGSFPRHKPLFNNAGGLKGTALEISNAFADFTDSTEHGPDVTQKFGSVGHTINNFLQMMGLGASGGFTDDAGGFGGGGDWASMDHSPIARSLDFYPGYGNQANLDEIDDLPIFHEDITEQFLRKMNLTDILEKITKSKESAKKENETEPQGDNIMKMTAKPKPMQDMIKINAKSNFNLPIKEMDTHLASILTYANDQKFESTKLDKNKSNMAPQKNKNVTEIEANKKEHFVLKPPTVNYRIPSSYSVVAPEDRKKPIAVYQSLAFDSTSSKNTSPTESISYSPAHPLPNHELEANINKLVDDNIPRQWVPVTNGKGYVEKQPKPIIDVIGENAEQPQGLKVLKHVVFETNKAHPLAM